MCWRKRNTMFMYTEERMLMSHIIIQGSIREWRDADIITKMIQAMLKFHPECAKNTDNRDVAEALFVAMKERLQFLEDKHGTTAIAELDGMISRGETFDALSW